jgi:hypothetical protein
MMKDKINNQFRCLKYLKKNPDRWFEVSQISHRLRIKYDTVRHILKSFKKEDKVFHDKKDNLYKYNPAYEIKFALELMVKNGYLKKTNKGFIDSDKVTKFLKEGKTRMEISNLLASKSSNGENDV